VAKLAVAVSGGVDSAVAAARLVDTGHEVTAIHLLLQPKPAPAIADALAVAEALGIPFLLWDLSESFERLVQGDFIDEYARGRTPNPCIRCNKTIKFGIMLERALETGFEAVATGHYARLIADAQVVQLHRASEIPKDQSYVLATLSQDVLQRMWLPLGASAKQQVRAEAVERGLPIASKSESMDLCFIPDDDTAGWLASRVGRRPGEIVDEAGTVLGSHDGTYLYTVGQRRGLDIRRPAADGNPRFVLGVDAESRRVVVGPRHRLAVDRLVAGPPVWSSGVATVDAFDACVQVRAHGEQHEASVNVQADGSIEIALHSPILGVAPGQTAVVYDGTKVVVAATINQAS